MKDSKKVAAAISITSNGMLIIIKFIAGFISGSISIISEAIHSGSDLLASCIAFFSVSKSEEPADSDHNFGHGKYEDFSGLIEGALIIGAAIYIIVEAFKKVVNPTTIEMNVDLGLLVMLISTAVNICISAYLFKMARISESMALYADAEHLRTDVYSSAAVFLGLVAVKISGVVILDPVIAICVAFIIFMAGLKICKQSSNNLLDKSLSHDQIALIRKILENHLGSEIISIKSIRTRRSGILKNIDIVLLTNPALHISTAHKLCDVIEHEIDEDLKNTDISIHLEPNLKIKV